VGDADDVQLVQRRLGAVVIDRDALDQAGRGAAGPDGLQVPVHDLDGTRHLVVGRGDDLVVGHTRAPSAARPAMSVPTGSPSATRAMLSWPFRSNTTIGRSFSMHSATGAPSMTLSWCRVRS